MIVRRIVALLILTALVCVVLTGLGMIQPTKWLPAEVATEFALPTGALPSLPDVINAIQKTAAPQTTTNPELPEVVLQGTPYISPTPQPTFTPTPIPVRNGRIIYLGVDKQIYSIAPSGGAPLRLGLSADFHLVTGPDWFSPDGRYVLAVEQQEGISSLYVVQVENLEAPIWVGNWVDGEQDPPRQRFEFSAGSDGLLFIERNDSQLILHLIELPGGRRLSMPLTGSLADLNQASFFGDRQHILVAQDDPAGGNPHLAVYQVQGDGFTPVSSLIAYPGYALDQFVVSPGAKWVALALKDGAGASTLFLVDASQLQAIPVFQDSNTRMLMLQPAWSPDGRYVLINRWQTAPELMYNLLAYDTENRASVALITSDSPTEGGSPVAVAASFAPDGQAVGLTLNDAQADSMTFWLAVLDGSYSRVITTSSDVGDFPQGEFVVGISPDWTHSVILASEVGSPLGSLYTAALDGTQRQLLDNLVPYQFLNIGPVLSPDGLSLAYLRLEGDVNTPVANLCVINLDGSSKQVIFSGASLDQGVPGIPLVWLPEKP